jgi:hypothetical protein
MNTTSSGSEGDDPLREARAYNNSIYLMVAMPYVLLGGFGFAVYRGVKIAQRQALKDRQSQKESPPGKSGPARN